MPHLHDKIDFTVEVFIVNACRVLLRKHDKYKLWLSVGGHIELDEDPNEAAVREVKEEVGLDIELYDPDAGIIASPARAGADWRLLVRPMFVHRHRIDERHEHVTFVYYARAVSDRLAPCADEASEECRWCSSDELDRMDVRDEIRAAAKDALKKLS